MAQMDLGGKVLLGINEVFADVANVLLFKGERLIDEKELSDAGTHSQYHTDGKYHEQIRDVAKYWKKHGVCLAMIGMENEARPNRHMPIRVLSYDGGAYRCQLPDDKRKKKRTVKRKKIKRIYPVITLVLNFNTKRRWKTAKSLLEVVDVPEILLPYVNDYRINVIDVAFLDREVIDSFKSEFWYVADYFWQIRNNKDYKPNRDRVRHIREILQMMSAVTGDKRFEEAYNKGNKTGGEGSMCEYLDRIVGEGERRGERRGRRRGEKLRAEKDAKKFLKLGKNTVEEIAMCTDLTVEEVRKLEAEICATA